MNHREILFGKGHTVKIKRNALFSSLTLKWPTNVALVTSRIRQFFSDFICCVELTLPLLQQRVVPVTTINFVCICSFTMGFKILKTFINYLRG